jgi:hypothetical protein
VQATVKKLRACQTLGATLAAAIAAPIVMPPAAQGWGKLPLDTHVTYRQSRIVPIPAAIPHDEGDEIDKRLLGNLLYLSKRFKTFYVADGYAGKPHKKFGEHPLGLAVDVVPANWDGRGCDGSWRQITRIARWAEPSRDQPRSPFRWVGYNRDKDHGCGDHLHLSWSHAETKPFRIADWVLLFDVP